MQQQIEDQAAGLTWRRTDQVEPSSILAANIPLRYAVGLAGEDVLIFLGEIPAYTPKRKGWYVNRFGIPSDA